MEKSIKLEFVVAFILVIFMILGMNSGWFSSGSGEKVGTVTRLQNTGIFCKTWEGVSQRGGINNGSGVIGGEFHFTVKDEGLVKKVQQAMESQQEVKISYEKKPFTICSSDSSNYFLTDIKPFAK